VTALHSEVGPKAEQSGLVVHPTQECVELLQTGNEADVQSALVWQATH
jgi:hypothetical protein